MPQRHNCEQCGWRARYDYKPNSFLGRIWRWHAGWCPGFKRYITSLPESERIELANSYGLTKYSI
jgi:hypothetical protein